MKNMHIDIPTFDKVVFAAMSKRAFYLREHIVKFILEQGYTPACAFMMYSYFLLDTVDRQALISANNALIRKSDELWVFGNISDGVAKEIQLARSINLPTHYYIPKDNTFIQILEKEAKIEC